MQHSITEFQVPSGNRRLRQTKLLSAVLSLIFAPLVVSDPAYGQFPSGSYASSCQNPCVNGTTLTGHCETVAGSWRHATLSRFDLCQPNTFWNHDGHLRCARRRSDPPSDSPDGLPWGTYKNSCRDSVAKDGILFSSCQTRSGDWLQATLDLTLCVGEKWNDDGRLNCIRSSE
jgi:hypothetical protein